MADETARIGLPMLSVGQAQKEVQHNEALGRIDMLLHGAVEESGVDDPPGSPVAGQAWIVGAAPSGAWSGQAGEVAAWGEGGWRFAVPVAGMALWDVSLGRAMLFDGSAWLDGILRATAVEIGGVQVLGARTGAIADPSGGATVDAEARAAIGDMLDAMRAHGLIGI